jgi:hypothetical protein
MAEAMTNCKGSERWKMGAIGGKKQEVASLLPAYRRLQLDIGITILPSFLPASSAFEYCRLLYKARRHEEKKCASPAFVSSRLCG